MEPFSEVFRCSVEELLLEGLRECRKVGTLLCGELGRAGTHTRVPRGGREEKRKFNTMLEVRSQKDLEGEAGMS